MKRFAILATAVVALATAAVSLAAPTARSARTTTIHLTTTSLGSILTNAGGRTIYVFARDPRNQDRCAAIKGCTSVWPMVKSSGRPLAGSGVSRALLGTIRVHGATQVTYAGRPLYTYAGDSSPGETAYVGFSQFGGTWSAVTAHGRLVK
jgi:predicted lipoprotein with Yx(FWY)xxD motif